MQITILLFATLRDLAGAKRITLTLPAGDLTIKQLRSTLIERYPHMQANFESALAAINEEFAFADDPVRPNDEVAFFPPVSGGQPDDQPEVFLLPETPVDHDALIAAITTPAVGAVCLFSGMVRGRTAKPGHLPETTSLEYEAYAPMALAKMRQVATEIRERWPKVVGIAVAQRIGRLEVGQNTVLIACSAPHRDDGCFEAARYGIDRLKEIVPVWKKEIGADGATWIEGDYQPQPTDRNTNQS